MKSPFKKLRDLAVSKHGLKEQSPDASLELEEESHDISRGMQEVEDMHLQYEGLATNAQIISGAAFDFSRALQDMASYMIETFGQIIDGEIGNVFSMLAKVQFEVSKLLDLFAAHVSQTIIGPTEMIIREIQQVQVMKEQYDEKRQSYNFLQKERLKRKSKNWKGSHFDQQSQSAKENMKGQADILSFRLQSLKQGQSRSLITQAARYHSAQIHFFQKGLASVNIVEPVMRQLALERNIDRTVSESDVSVSGNVNELPVEVDSTRNYESESMASSPTNFLDSQVEDGTTSAQAEFAPKLEGASKSDPLSPSMYYQKEPLSHFQDLSLENFEPKVSMYALPSPSDKSGNWASQTSKQNTLRPSKSHHYSGNTSETFNQDLGSHYIDRKRFGEHNSEPSRDWGSGFQAAQVMASQQSLKLPNKASTGVRQIGRTYSHSGPLMHNYGSSVKHKPDSLSQVNQASPIYNSGPIGRSSMPVYASNASQTAPLSLLSPPQISELHKLPPPPSSSNAPSKPAGHITYSAPLGNKAPEMQPLPGPASPLPPPPGRVPRSLSIPSSADHKHAFHQHNTQETFHSPVLKPMTLPAATSVLH